MGPDHESRLPSDARVYQILFLAMLLATGALVRDFSLAPRADGAHLRRGARDPGAVPALGLKIRGPGT